MRSRSYIPYLLLCVYLSACTGRTYSPSLVQHAAGKIAREYLKAFNSGADSAMQRFFEQDLAREAAAADSDQPADGAVPPDALDGGIIHAQEGPRNEGRPGADTRGFEGRIHAENGVPVRGGGSARPVDDSDRPGAAGGRGYRPGEGRFRTCICRRRVRRKISQKRTNSRASFSSQKAGSRSC